MSPAKPPKASSVIRGAEALVEPAAFLDRPAMAKRRVVKGYRHPRLDARLRDERTRDEAGLLLAAAKAGVPVPRVLDIDRRQATLMLQPISGPSLRSVLASASHPAAVAHLEALGVLVARLHDAGLTHGDLTTSNVLVTPDGPVLIDFGLGQFSQEDEPRGVDLHLVEEALEATDDRADALFAAFLAGYGAAACASAAIRRLEAIRERGRYRSSHT